MIIETVLINDYFENHHTLKERYDVLERIWESDRYGVPSSIKCISPFNDKVTCWLNSDVREWLEWVNLNICLHIASDTDKTTGVKLRIATGMLNKIESLSDIEKIQIHSNLTNNVYEEKFLLINGELPF